MDNTLYILAAAMDYAATEQQRLAGNLANSQTAGFKEVLAAAESRSPQGDDALHPVLPYYQATTVFSQGVLEKTGEPLDIALQGDGFLALAGKDGKRYWRSGALLLDPEGYLVTSHGDKVLGSDGPIQLSSQNLSELRISPSGQIFSGDKPLATVKLVAFAQPGKLVSQEGSYLNLSGQEEQTADGCRLYQGFLEKSTVESVQAMSDLVSNLRYLEAMQKITRVMDEGWQNLTSIV